MPADGPRGTEGARSNGADPRGFPPKGVAAGIVAAIAIADQWTKSLVEEHLPLYGSVSVIDGFLDLIHVRNTGVAFGLLNSVDIPFKAGLMTAVALAALVALGIYATQLSPRETLARLGLTLIAGGAVGNLIDRATAGYVVDFVDVYWGGWHFWAFNVADAAITVGASCLIFELLFLNRHVSEAA